MPNSMPMRKVSTNTQLSAHSLPLQTCRMPMHPHCSLASILTIPQAHCLCPHRSCACATHPPPRAVNVHHLMCPTQPTSTCITCSVVPGPAPGREPGRAEPFWAGPSQAQVTAHQGLRPGPRELKAGAGSSGQGFLVGDTNSVSTIYV